MRCGPHQTLAPPSIHPSGEVVNWIADGEPATVAYGDLLAAVETIAAAVLVIRYGDGAHDPDDVDTWLDAVLSAPEIVQQRVHEWLGRQWKPKEKTRTEQRYDDPGAERRYIEEALSYIPSDPREEWLRAGMALHQSGHSWARSTWDSWSRQSGKFDAKTQDATWSGFGRNAGTRVTIGWIVEEARRGGFRGHKRQSDYQDRCGGFDDAPPHEERINVGEPGEDGDRSDVCDQFDAVWFDGDSEPEPVPTIVEDMIPARGLTFLGGQSGAAKTFAAVDLGVALATHQPFCGRDTEETLGVIYCAAEGAATIASRLAAAKIGRSVTGKIPFAVIKNVPDLTAYKDRRAFIIKLKAVAQRLQEQFGARVGAVMIDTVAACFSVKDENAAGEMNAVCKSASELGDAIGAATIALAHYGKDQSTGIRGSSATRGAGESVLALIAERDEIKGEVKNRRLVHVKSRVGEEGATFPFDLEHVHLGFDAKGRPFGAARVVLKDSQIEPGEKRLSRAERAYLEAFAVKMDEAEAVRPFGHEGPEVKAVHRESIRAEFYASWTCDVPTGKSKADAQRQAFNRAERALKDLNRIGTRTVNGRDLVWRVGIVTRRDRRDGQDPYRGPVTFVTRRTVTLSRIVTLCHATDCAPTRGCA